jgi:hypothetical protein
LYDRAEEFVALVEQVNAWVVCARQYSAGIGLPHFLTAACARWWVVGAWR